MAEPKLFRIEFEREWCKWRWPKTQFGILMIENEMVWCASRDPLGKHSGFSTDIH